jgi:hypothetical protein
MKTRSFVLLLTIALVASFPVCAQPGRCPAVGGAMSAPAGQCEVVGGVLMTNINSIEGTTNLGPVFGDLQGSVAAKILGQNSDGSYTVQHYWVTSSGDTILFKPAILKAAATSDSNVAVVLWGNYVSEIYGGTGKFQGARGQIEYFGVADFKQLTLVLRYRGAILYPNP